MLAVITIIFDFGFDQIVAVQNTLYYIYTASIALGIFSLIGRYFLHKDRPRVKSWPFDALLLLFLSLLLGVLFGWLDWPYLDIFSNKKWLYVAAFFVFIREVSALNFDLKKQYFNPAQLFILSFLAMVLMGTILLLLPKSTHEGISFTDALFTSTSAVCVTGLAVVDTGTYFTPLGQTLILILIQLGGLGIMTFTSYFSYFFRGGSSYENQLLLKDMTNSEKIADVFSTLKKIILLTFIIEFTGAMLIYLSLDKNHFPTLADRAFFSFFHAVSGFCNAGFSTLTNSLYETGFRFNYPLHLTIAMLFISGGIGFPIMFNSLKFIRHLIVNRLFSRRNRQARHIPRTFNINNRIVLITTSILIVSGTLFFFVFEYNNTLSEHKGIGKLVTAFFGAATPRTAGFNTVDTSALHFSTLMLVIFLMWVGASPASTGGGIKTSTLAIGILNIISLARGKDRIEMFQREVSNVSLRRAFAIISLSLITIGISVFFVATFDNDKGLRNIIFECISAFSTTGLSLGITGNLSSASKMVLILTMLVGRVGMLTLLIAVLRKVKHLKYRYPTEEILIN